MSKGIIFFDGECGFCNAWILFVAKNDIAPDHFCFASLQSQTAKDKLPANLTKNLDTIVVLNASNNICVKSDAVVYVLSQLNIFFRILAYFIKLIPHSVSFAAYDLIAKNRTKISKFVCTLPPEDIAKAIQYKSLS